MGVRLPTRSWTSSRSTPRRTVPTRRSSSTPRAAHTVGHDVRRARGRRQPPRPRAPARSGRVQRRPHRVVRTELARGPRHVPRRPQGRPDVGAAVVPLQRRGDAVRHRQLRRDGRGRRRRAGAARRVGPRPAAQGARGVVFGGAAPDGLRPTGTTWSAPQARTADEPVDADASAAAGAAMIYTSGTTGKPKGALRTGDRPARSSSRCSPSSAPARTRRRCTSRPVRCTTRVRSRSRSLAHTLGGTDRRAAQVRPGRVAAAGEGAPRHEHVLGADAAEADRDASRPTSWRAPTCRRCACLIANAAPVPYALKQEIIEKLGDGFLYEVYGSTELGVVTVLAARGPAAQAGFVRQAVRRRSRSASSRDDGTDAPTGEPGELFIRTTLAMDGYHRTERAAHASSTAGSGSRSATSRTSTTRATSTSATARRT